MSFSLAIVRNAIRAYLAAPCFVLNAKCIIPVDYLKQTQGGLSDRTLTT